MSSDPLLPSRIGCGLEGLRQLREYTRGMRSGSILTALVMHFFYNCLPEELRPHYFSRNIVEASMHGISEDDLLRVGGELRVTRFQLLSIIEMELIEEDRIAPLYALLALSHGQLRRAGVNPFQGLEKLCDLRTAPNFNC